MPGQAVDISCLSIYKSEKESLLAPGTVLRVASRKRTGTGAKTVTEVQLVEVGSALE